MANGIDLRVKETQVEVEALIQTLKGVSTEIINISNASKTISQNLKNVRKPSDLVQSNAEVEKQLASLQKKLEAHEKTIQALKEKRQQQDTQQAIREETLLNKKLKNDQLKLKSEQEASDKIIKQREKEFKEFEKEYNKYIADLKKKEQEEKRAGKEAENQSKRNEARIKSEQKAREAQVKKESDLRERLSALKKKEEADVKRLEKEQAKLNSIYEQTNTKLTQVQQEYRDLAVQKELNNKLTLQEETRMSALLVEMQAYNKVLIKVDEDMGKHTRKVGHYERSWNGLGNSINQLTREAPAFAVSMSTGFLALSNNIPILADEIRQLTDRNKELIAQGKPTQSVFKAIAGSLFSWMTLLSVGVTLLTLYGDEMVDFISKIAKGDDILKDTIKIQKEINFARNEGIKNSIKQRVATDEQILMIKNENIALSDRIKIGEELINQYPKIFKNVTAYELATKKEVDAVKILDKALQADEQIKAILDKQEARRTKLYEENVVKRVENNKKLLSDLEKTAKKQAELAKGDTGALTFTPAGTIDTRTERQKAYAQTINRINALTIEQTNLQNMLTNAVNEQKLETKDITELQRLSVLLKDEEIKKEERLIDLIDEKLSLYDLTVNQLEFGRDFFKQQADDEALSFEKRTEAREKYFKYAKDLADTKLAEDLRLLEIYAKEEKQKINDSTENDKKKKLAQSKLDKDVDYKRQLANKEHEQGLYDINIQMERLNANASELKSITDQEIILIDETQIQLQKQLNALLETLPQDRNKVWSQEVNRIQSMIKANDTVQKQLIELRDIRVEMKFLDNAGNANSEKYIELKKKEKEIEKAIEISKGNQLEEATKLLEVQEATLRNYFNQFSGEFLSNSGFGSLSIFTQMEVNEKSVWTNLIESAKAGKKEYAVIFNQIGEIAQDTFKFMDMLNEQKYQSDLRNLDLMQQNAMTFATTEEQKAEINRQIEAEKRELNIKRAKQQRDMARFNIITDLAQSLISVWVKPGYPTAIALSALLAGVGAAQLSAVNNAPLPAFKDGVRNFEGGMAIVGDGGVSEIIRTKNGDLFKTPNTDTLVNLPKGADVFKSEKDYILNNGMNIENNQKINALNAEQMDGIMMKYFNNITVNETTFDKNGFNMAIVRNGQRQKFMNNRQSYKGTKFN